MGTDMEIKIDHATVDDPQSLEGKEVALGEEPQLSLSSSFPDMTEAAAVSEDDEEQVEIGLDADVGVSVDPDDDEAAAVSEDDDEQVEIGLDADVGVSVDPDDDGVSVDGDAVVSDAGVSVDDETRISDDEAAGVSEDDHTLPEESKEDLPPSIVLPNDEPTDEDDGGFEVKQFNNRISVDPLRKSLSRNLSYSNEEVTAVVDDDVSVTSNISLMTSQTNATTQSRLDEIRMKRKAFQKQFKHNLKKQSPRNQDDSKAIVPDVIVSSKEKKDKKKKKKKKRKEEVEEMEEQGEPQFEPQQPTRTPEETEHEKYLAEEIRKVKDTISMLSKNLLEKDKEVQTLQGSLEEASRSEPRKSNRKSDFGQRNKTDKYSSYPPVSEMKPYGSEDNRTVMTGNDYLDCMTIADEITVVKSVYDERTRLHDDLSVKLTSLRDNHNGLQKAMEKEKKITAEKCRSLEAQLDEMEKDVQDNIFF
jgi:hypothetical protein